MTEITRWRDPAAKSYPRGPLPEPPRSRHVSKWGRDDDGAELEEWLRDVAVTTTIDAD